MRLNELSVPLPIRAFFVKPIDPPAVSVGESRQLSCGLQCCQVVDADGGALLQSPKASRAGTILLCRGLKSVGEGRGVFTLHLLQLRR